MRAKLERLAECSDPAIAVGICEIMLATKGRERMKPQCADENTTGRPSPVGCCRPAHKQPHIAMKKKPTKQTILIVEDDPQVMEVFSLLLAESGYEIMKADSALPALLSAGGKLPDLILADLNMPHMNGLELIGQFKKYADTLDIPIIVVTGSEEPADRKAAFKAGCAGYITKPISSAKFLAQIEECLPKPKG